MPWASLPGVPVDDGRVDGFGGPQPLVLGGGDAVAVAVVVPAVDHVTGVFGVGQHGGDVLRASTRWPGSAAGTGPGWRSAGRRWRAGRACPRRAR